MKILSTLACFVACLFLLSLPSGASEIPESIWAGAEKRPAGGLPDGSYAVFNPGSKDAVAAWYGTPTRRYRHAILGDDIEAGSLHVALRDGRMFEVHLPESEVFEDRTPRITDLDGDGRFEVITIRSFANAGGSVAIYGLRGGKLVELASTKPIGRANRWLNIAGIADYAGRGKPQIAYVETPHIGGTLYFVEWRGKALVPIASIAGFSNHRIGAREQNLSADIDFNADGRPDIAVPSNDRQTLRIVAIEGGKAKELHQVRFPAAVKSRRSSGSGCVEMRLTNGGTGRLCREN
ncbi:hypothetical protein [Roseibium sp.]|uniref:hypothetical protein n=1 Tax=Roseibium sp. TaxID=1936156 RepID=UPI003B514515